MKIRIAPVVLALAAYAMPAAPAHAQEWRGVGRAGGFVVDEAKKPIQGVRVKATLPASQNRGPEPGTSKANGEWAVGGLTGGSWSLDFEKDGYETRRITVPISEGGRLLPLEIVMKKAVVVVVVDPNEAIKVRLTEASALMSAGKFAEARMIYEALQTEHPQVKQFRPLIARAYYGEGNKEKAIEILRAAATADPANVEVSMLLGNLLMEAGKADEAKAVMSAIDDSKVTDPVVYVNMGIGLLNEGKQAEAIPWLDRAITRFPTKADAYYYRGVSYLGIGKQAEAKADLEKFVKLAPADAPELPTAKKILESIK